MLALGIIDKIDPTDLDRWQDHRWDGQHRRRRCGGADRRRTAEARGRQAGRRDVLPHPKDNCAEAAANALPGLSLVKVGTLDEALTALQTIRVGRLTPVVPGRLSLVPRRTVPVW
jgi:PDZ domain-containing protein